LLVPAVTVASTPSASDIVTCANRSALQPPLARAPKTLPDIHPNFADIYRCRLERLADALNRPEERHEAAEAIRGLIERVTLTPGHKRGQIDATLHGELGAILDWLARNSKDGRATMKAQNANTPGLAGSGVSVSVVAGTGFEPVTSRL